ncbi:hypothetical protein [Enterobacter roggenkampii]|uniref:hypothetical protein n=1 Tax=Enterobacter roggenkampii TaxID=1812935 RepID=UPI00165981DF|nr:hypothetical protein [Enterobacter roggenkampii]QNQ31352.1 hypothetical protein H9W87_09700 [Enterobacter roggenkampii]
MSNQELTEVIVTKYALSSGPFKVMDDVSHDGTMASYRLPGCYLTTAHGKDFWLNEADALADCERRRLAKIKSLEKQKKKLESMTFLIEGAAQ